MHRMRPQTGGTPQIGGMPQIGGLLVGLGVGIILYFGFLKFDRNPSGGVADDGTEPRLAPSLHAPAPNFELSSLSGEAVQLEDYRGQIVLLNFWATWCPPCRLEMPTLQSRAEQYPHEFAVVAINNAEAPADVRDFVAELDLSFDVLLDPDGAVQRLYRVRGYPTTYIIDAEGVIRVEHIGLITEKQLAAYLVDLGLETDA